MTKLRVLDIRSNLFPIDTSVLCLRHFGKTLSSLSLTGCYRSFEDVEEVIDLLVDLGSLRIGIGELCPELMDLFSVRLLKLRRLEMVVRYVIPNVVDKPRFDRRETQIVSPFSPSVAISCPTSKYWARDAFTGPG